MWALKVTRPTIAARAADGSALTFRSWYINWLHEADETLFKTRRES
jgi:hypothetical protein